MVSKKKRKSVGAAEEQPPKRPSAQQGRRSSSGGAASGAPPPLAWSAEGLTVTLPAGQGLLLLGRASLAVQSGELSVFGSLITAASGSLEVCADERCGGALLLEPGAALGTVPLAASSTVVFTLMRCTGSGAGFGGPPATPNPRQQQKDASESGSGGGSRRQLGFEAWLSSDPAAPAAPPPLPPLWQQAADEVDETLGQLPPGMPPVIVVCGAKKVGKSTFARFLANSLLTRHASVAYLDTDCGQPEFTAPGLVSLSQLQQPVLGPPHMHQRRPAASFFLGDTSPASDPLRYLQCIRELYRWYSQHAVAAATGVASPGPPQQQQQQPPLVVNTHGWVKGMGFDLLIELLQSLPVSHMVQIAAANPRKNLPAGAFWAGPAAAVGSGGVGVQQQTQQTHAEVLHWLLPGIGEDQQQQHQQQQHQQYQQPAASETSAAADAGAGGGRGRLHAVEQRALQWEALAQQCIDNCGMAGPSTAGGGSRAAAAAAAGGDLGDRLAAAVPFEVDSADVEVQVLHSSVPASQLFYALNGTVVGLCGPASAPQKPAAAAPAPAGAGVAPAPPAAALPCLGLGIVRAADAARRRLHILTTVPPEELEGVTTLQLGKLELPGSLLQTGAHMAPYLCLFSLSSMGTGAGAIKSRNNLLRQSQL